MKLPAEAVILGALRTAQEKRQGMVFVLVPMPEGGHGYAISYFTQAVLARPEAKEAITEATWAGIERARRYKGRPPGSSGPNGPVIVGG